MNRMGMILSIALLVFSSIALSDELTVAQYLELKEAGTLQKSFFGPGDLNSSYSSWGVDPSNQTSSINLSGAWKIYQKVGEAIVAVVDTGIDNNHPFLKNNIITLEGRATASNFGVDFSKKEYIDSQKRPVDVHGHGTHVTGIIKSINPKVKILPIKYYRAQASGQDNLKATIEALEYAVNNNIPIINYSGGGPQASAQELKILKRAQEKGILIVAAAGNNESNLDVPGNSYYPASYGLSNVISVAAYAKDLSLFRSSNYGRSSIDLMAPGHEIKSSVPNSRAGYLSGTSQATAFVTGVASLIKSNFPQLNGQEIKKILMNSVKKESQFLSLCITGGRLDAQNALLTAKEYVRENQAIQKIASHP